MQRSVSGFLDQARFAFDKGPADRSALLIVKFKFQLPSWPRQDHITEVMARERVIAPAKILSLLAKPNDARHVKPARQTGAAVTRRGKLLLVAQRTETAPSSA
jgi:hypothetical protein